MKKHSSLIMGISVIAFLGGCASVKIPDVDFFKLPEHKVAQEDVLYPEVGDAPKAPTDTRSAKNWDRAARALLKKRDNFNAPASVAPNKSPEQLQQDFDELEAKVKEYKEDDPQ